MRRCARAVVVVAMALALGACGSGGGGEAGPGEMTNPNGPLTKAQFVEQGNAICKVARESLAKEADKAGIYADTISEDQMVPYMKGILVPFYRRQIEAMRGLEAPPDDQKKLDGAFDAMEEVLDDMEAHPRRHLDDEDPFADANEVFEDYGLKACSS